MKVTIKDKTIELSKGKEVAEIAKEEIEKSDNLVIACKINNRTRPLNYIIKEDCKIDLIDISSKDGMRIYTRSLLYIMGKAFSEVYPDALLTVNYQLSNAMYCKVENKTVTEEMIQKVDKKMKEIIQNNIPIIKVNMTKEEAEAFYEKEKTLKGKLQLDMKQNVCLYFCEDYYNYFYGIMPPSTGYTKIYGIRKYQEGFLVRYPSRQDTKQLPLFKESKKLLATLEDYEDIHRIVNVNTVYKLNKAIKEGKVKDIIMLDEALHEKKLAAIADKIASRKEVKVVLIAGPSSSGKTTFAQRLGLQLRLNGLKPVTISVDNYFVERADTPKDENGKYDFERLEAIDLKLFNEHLTKLLAGEEIEMPTFDFETGTKRYNGNYLKLRKDEILVIEGIHCLNDKLTESINKENKYKIYVSALTVLNIDYYNRISTTDTRLVRRIVRDHQFRGYSALHTLQTWDSVNRGENQYIFPYQEGVDSMFNTSLIYELAVLKNDARPLLEEIDTTYPEYSEAKRIYEFLKYFEPIDPDEVPKNSLLREFIGGGNFKY